MGFLHMFWLSLGIFTCVAVEAQDFQTHRLEINLINLQDNPTCKKESRRLDNKNFCDFKLKVRGENSAKEGSLRLQSEFPWWITISRTHTVYQAKLNMKENLTIDIFDYDQANYHPDRLLAHVTINLSDILLKNVTVFNTTECAKKTEVCLKIIPATNVDDKVVNANTWFSKLKMRLHVFHSIVDEPTIPPCTSGAKYCYPKRNFQGHEIEQKQTLGEKNCLEYCSKLALAVGGMYDTSKETCYCKSALVGTGNKVDHQNSFAFASNTRKCIRGTLCFGMRAITTFAAFPSKIVRCGDSDSEIHFGDFNGDGYCDPVCWNKRTQETHWAVGWKTLGFKLPAQGDNVGRFCIANSKIEVRDVNDDGKDDLVCTKTNQHMLSGFMGLNSSLLDPSNNGESQERCDSLRNNTRACNSTTLCGAMRTITTFAAYPSKVVRCGDSDGEIHFGDFNGDGYCDPVCWNKRTLRTLWAYGKGTLRFHLPFQGENVGPFCVANSKIEVRDVNGDGKDDLVCIKTNEYMLSGFIGLNSRPLGPWWNRGVVDKRCDSPEMLRYEGTLKLNVFLKYPWRGNFYFLVSDGEDVLPTTVFKIAHFNKPSYQAMYSEDFISYEKSTIVNINAFSHEGGYYKKKSIPLDFSRLDSVDEEPFYGVHDAIIYIQVRGISNRIIDKSPDCLYTAKVTMESFTLQGDFDAVYPWIRATARSPMTGERTFFENTFFDRHPEMRPEDKILFTNGTLTGFPKEELDNVDICFYLAVQKQYTSFLVDGYQSKINKFQNPFCMSNFASANRKCYRSPEENGSNHNLCVLVLFEKETGNECPTTTSEPTTTTTSTTTTSSTTTSSTTSTTTTSTPAPTPTTSSSDVVTTTTELIQSSDIEEEESVHIGGYITGIVLLVFFLIVVLTFVWVKFNRKKSKAATSKTNRRQPKLITATVKGLVAPTVTATVKGSKAPTVTATVKGSKAPTVTASVRGSKAPTVTATVKGSKAPTVTATVKGSKAPTVTATVKGLNKPTAKKIEKKKVRKEFSKSGGTSRT